MWINELEFEYTPDALSLTQEQYAPIYVRYMTYALAHGVDKLFFASFKNPPPHIPPDMPAPFTDASALIDSRDQRTLLFHVVQTFIQRFDYFSSVEILVEKIEAAEYSHKEKAKLVTEGQYKFVVDGKTHYILWGTGGVPAEIKGDLIVTDIFGKTSERNANAVVLTTEPIYVTLK
jgi:hypothetical protein